MALDERLEYARESALRRAANLAYFIDSRLKMARRDNPNASLRDVFSEKAYNDEIANLENLAGVSFDELKYENRLRQAATIASGVIAAQPENVSRRYFTSTLTKAILGFAATGNSRVLRALSSPDANKLLKFLEVYGRSPTPISPNPNVISPIAAAEPVAAKNSIVNLFDATQLVPFGDIYVLDGPAGRVGPIPIINGAYEITPAMNLVPGTYKLIIDTSRGGYGVIRGHPEIGFEAVLSAAGFAVDNKDGRYDILNVMRLINGNRLGTGDINKDMPLDLYLDLFHRSDERGANAHEPRHSQRHMQRLDLAILAENLYRANSDFITRIDSIGPYRFLPQVWERLVASIRRDLVAYSDGFYPPEDLPPGTLPSYVKVLTDVNSINPRTRGKGYWFPLDNIPTNWSIAQADSGTDAISHFIMANHPTYLVTAADFAHDTRESLGVRQRNGVGIDRNGISHPSMATGSRGHYGRGARQAIDTKGYPTEYILPVAPTSPRMSEGTSYRVQGRPIR